jgi:hypothetical protein
MIGASDLTRAQDRERERQEIKTQAQEEAGERREILTQTQEQVKAQEKSRERIYGSDLMTEQERIEYREKMRSMNSEQERNAFRAQHHEEMKRRAREMNMEIPDEVPAKPGGKGMSQRDDGAFRQGVGAAGRSTGKGQGKKGK